MPSQRGGAVVTRIKPFGQSHLSQVRDLVNAHLAAVVPGWALPGRFIASRLARNPGQYVIDPWVIERATLCAIERGRVVAAAHLLRYGSDEEVGDYRGVGDIAWALAWPGSAAALRSLLVAAHSQMTSWGVRLILACDAGLPVPVCVGVPDAWPQIARAFHEAGYRPDPEADEAVYAGSLVGIPCPGAPPIDGVTLDRQIGRLGGIRLTAALDGRRLGHCECTADLTLGGTLSAFRGWSELAEIEVREDLRSQGVGAWLMQHAGEWLRLGGCDRVVLAVSRGDEAAGAGRFYQRFGLRALARTRRGWRRDVPVPSGDGSSAGGNVVRGAAASETHERARAGDSASSNTTGHNRRRPGSRHERTPSTPNRSHGPS